MGARDDTLINLLSDNGATAEGSRVGMADVRGVLYGASETPEARERSLATLAGEDSFPAHPLGWAEASNTPLRWYKSTTHEGGIGTPLIMSWPNGGFANGTVRRQFLT